MKIAFLGTPDFAVPTLEMLLKNHSNMQVSAVITQPERPAGRDLKPKKSRVSEVVDEFNLKAGLLTKKVNIFTPEDPNTDEDLAEFITHNEIDVGICVAYGKILKQEFIDLFPKGILNIHASLLPRWRGAAPIAWTLLSDDKRTGVTIQKISPQLDAGDIVAQISIEIPEDWDAVRLYTELSKRGAELLRKTLPEYLDGKIELEKQDEKLVTLAPKIKKEQGLINWNQMASQIINQIRALTPWPGTYTTRNGSILKILRASKFTHAGEGKPGDLVGQDKFAFYVQCISGTGLKIEVVQPENRNRMPASEYTKGKPFVKGDKLGT